MGNYITVDEVLAEGVPGSDGDPRIEGRIAKWEAIIERLTRNVFRAVSPGELIFDGTNTPFLWFGVPIISVTTLYANGGTDALVEDTDFRVHNSTSPPKDDRQNPRIELLGGRSDSIYRRTANQRFLKGQDQKITASWGYLENGATPEPIKHVLLQLVAMDFDGYFDTAGFGPGAISPLRRERTDGAELEYQITERARVVWGMIPQDLANILALYRAPWKIAVPDARRYYSVPDASLFSYF